MQMIIPKKNLLGWPLLLAINVYWGITTVLMKHILQYTDSVTYVFLRFLTAGVVLLVLYHRLIFSASRRVVLRGLILGALMTAPLQCTVLGLGYTSTTNSVFISQLSIVIVPIFVCIQARQLPRRHLVITILIMLTGVFMLAGMGNDSLNIGDVITLASAILNSLHVLVTCRFAREDDPVQLGVIQVLFGTAIAGVFCVFLSSYQFVVCIESVLILLLTGVIGTGACFVLIVVAQRVSSPVTVSLMALNTSVFGVIGAAIIPDRVGQTEVISPNMIWGSIIICIGMVWYILSDSRIKNVYRARLAGEDKDNANLE